MQRIVRAVLSSSPSLSAPRRHLNVHEYQCQKILAQYHVSVPQSYPATSVQEAVVAAKALGIKQRAIVMKAQILAGGRGLGSFTSGLQGGVHVCATIPMVRAFGEQMIGHTLVTKQTGSAGRKVSTILIAERCDVLREMYFAIMFDRSAGGPVMIASPKGGVNIEDVAATTPEFIFKEAIHPLNGPSLQQLERLARGLCGQSEQGPLSSVADKVRAELMRMWTMFDKTDCSMLEINPMAELKDGRVVCLDAKVNFDDNAAFRQKEIFAMRDMSQEDTREVLAAQYDLNYIALSGNIACLVNGAGLAMATMDILKHYGGDPANFLDVGGGATKDQVLHAIKILAADPTVRAIFVNIFGGIMRCDVIASGVLEAAKEINLQIPLVMRLEGTRVAEAKALIAESNFKGIIMANSFTEAAETVVAAVKSSLDDADDEE